MRAARPRRRSARRLYEGLQELGYGGAYGVLWGTDFDFADLSWALVCGNLKFLAEIRLCRVLN